MSPESKLQPDQGPRGPYAVRVFVSSTFRDMQEERDELVKRIFPQLRSLCEQRAIAWGEVDLRWGVTDEQAAEDQVLPICLEEIRRCRPYFIGLLGERYGWVPDEIPEELVRQESWLQECHERSVTELEILHGVLNDPAMADKALFYFRDPAYIDSLPAEEHALHREVATADEIRCYGPEEAERRAAGRRQKLASLKERIRASGLPVREGYPTPQALGVMVLQDLTAIIDRLFPEGSQPDPIDQEAAEHEAFARSRAGVYISGESDYARLDAHAEGDALPLVVLGESGSGKSALLANWALRYRETHPTHPLIAHYVGATPHSADWAAMVRRIMGELARRLGIQEAIPSQPAALRAAFAKWLSMASTRARVVLILDGLNQLEDRDQAPDLAWLPTDIPANIRLVVSTLPGRPLDELVRRGWPTLEVQPLAPGERRRLIVDYLAQYAKALSTERVERIAAAEQSANPLYLRALLEELRLFGVHQQLDERIGHCLEAGTVAQLYEKVLARYEEDYDRDRPGLVGEAMSLLWAARKGLSEVELLDLLGRDGRPLPRALWSPLYLAAEQSLVDRSGLLGFFHDYLRQAVQQRFLPGEATQRAAHLRLAGYFSGREVGRRRVDEEPFHWAQARLWKRLYELLANLAFFDAAWKSDPFQVKAYWAQVEAASGLRAAGAYQGVLSAPGNVDPETVWAVGILLGDTGYPAEAMSLRRHLAERHREKGDRARLAASLGGQAVILTERGDLEGAMALYKEEERLCREMGDKQGLIYSLGNQAILLFYRGEAQKAMALHKEQERLCRELGDDSGLARALGSQALILKSRGDPLGAMELHKEEERLCRRVGDKDGLQRTLGNQGLNLYERGDLDGALAALREQERLCRELGDKGGLATSLGNQGNIRAARNDPEGAMALYEEQSRLCRELGDKRQLSVSLVNQSAILAERDDLERAMALLQAAERLCREIGDKEGLAGCLGGQSDVLAESGDPQGAMALSKEAERLCRELGDKRMLSHVLTNQALLLAKDMNRRSKALALLDEAYRLASECSSTETMEYAESLRAVLRRSR